MATEPGCIENASTLAAWPAGGSFVSRQLCCMLDEEPHDYPIGCVSSNLREVVPAVNGNICLGDDWDRQIFPIFEAVLGPSSKLIAMVINVTCNINDTRSFAATPIPVAGLLM